MSNNTIDYVRERLAAASGAIEFEPDVMLDLSSLEFGSLPVLLAAVIGRGNRDKHSIQGFLNYRNCPYKWEIIEFVLDYFEGKSTKSSLWSVDKAGIYHLIVKPWSKYD